MPLVRQSGDGPLGNLCDVDITIRSRKEVNDRFAPILGMYERFLDVELRNVKDYLTKINVQVTPPEINQFMRMTHMYDGHPQYNSDDGYTGRFISSLMQRAIRDGHVDFTLDMNGLQPLHHVGSNIEGTLERKVNVTINGEAGDWCLYGAQNVGTAKIGKAGNDCLGSAQNVETVKIGNAGNDCLGSAQNVETANIQNAGYGCLWYARNVENVYTPNHDLAQKIKNSFITWKKRCKIHHISQEDFEARMRR